MNFDILMEIAQINLKKINRNDLIEHLQSGVIIKPNVKHIKELHKKSEKSITEGDYATTINLLIICLYFDYNNTFNFIQRKGLFRYSKYINRKCIVKNIAIETLVVCQLLENFSNEHEEYLNSIIHYSAVFDLYNETYQLILKEFKTFEKKYKGKSLIKTLLSLVDYLFLANFYPETTDDLMNYQCRSKEQVSAAVSYLIYLYSEQRRDINTEAICEEYILSGEINRLLTPVCYFLDFKEFEVLIDHFNYKFSWKGQEKKFSLKAPFEDFERSIRLGYIKTELQKINDFVEPKNAVSFDDVVEEINREINFQFLKKIETGIYSRYRIEMPEPVFDHILKVFIKEDALFKDEIVYLSSIFKEQLLTPTDLSNIRLKESLTLFDFIKVQRIFFILYTFFTKEVYKIENNETNLLLRSLIPKFSENHFYSLLEKLISREKIDAFLDLVCWEPRSEGIFDVQYRPILYINGEFMVTLSVFANSNMIRNLFASEYKVQNPNLIKDGTIDALVDRLGFYLKKAGLESWTETPIGNTDIDLFAVFENTLFIFECKHNLHPVSVYDLRTTYDYIKKAETQLDKITEAFNNASLIPIIEKKHRIDLSSITNIQCSIILSNRMFSGNIFRYPVRNINEIDNVFNRGVMRTEFGSFWLWKDKKLTLDYLLDYFSLENELVRLLYDCLSPKKQVYKFISNIEFDTYSLKLEEARPYLKKYVESLEQVEIK